MAPFSQKHMANIKSAAKRARQGEIRHTRNSSVISALKSGQKKLHAALAAGKLDEAKTEYVKVSSALDKAGFQIIATAMRDCIVDPDAAEDSGGQVSLPELEKLFMTLA